MIWFTAFFMAWGMFLSLPCPVRKWDEAARSRMLVLFPLIGCIVGGLWALSAWLLRLVHCPQALSALVLAAFPWLITGFIHLDGYSDVCDAILSRRDLETRRRILKDPHIGAFGVIALALLMLASFAVFLSAAEEQDSRALLVSLALVPVSARASAGLAMLTLRRMESSQYAETKPKPGYISALAAMLAAAAVTPAIVFGVHGLAPAAACLAYWAAAYGAFRNLGGMNGDVSGFALTLAELVGAAVLILLK